jgi:hypothetical protein
MLPGIQGPATVPQAQDDIIAGAMQASVASMAGEKGVELHAFDSTSGTTHELIRDVECKVEVRVFPVNVACTSNVRRGIW